MNPILTDEEMIRRYLPTQPTQCLNVLYHRYAAVTYRQCLRMTHDPQQAQDFTHDIFIKVLSKLGTFTFRSRFSTWLYAIAQHYCLDQLARASRLPTVTLLLANDWEQPDPDESLLREESIQLLTDILLTLPPSDQHLLTLKYGQGLSLEQLARMYGLKVEVIKTRLQRSRHKAQRLYARQWLANPRSFRMN